MSAAPGGEPHSIFSLLEPSPCRDMPPSGIRFSSSTFSFSTLPPSVPCDGNCCCTMGCRESFIFFLDLAKFFGGRSAYIPAGKRIPPSGLFFSLSPMAPYMGCYLISPHKSPLVAVDIPNPQAGSFFRTMPPLLERRPALRSSSSSSSEKSAPTSFFFFPTSVPNF